MAVRTMREQAEALLADPLDTLPDWAKKLNCSVRFLKDEEKRKRLKIVRLSPQMLRVRRSEMLRYLGERENGEVAA